MIGLRKLTLKNIFVDAEDDFSFILTVPLLLQILKSWNKL